LVLFVAAGVVITALGIGPRPDCCRDLGEVELCAPLFKRFMSFKNCFGMLHLVEACRGHWMQRNLRCKAECFMPWCMPGLGGRARRNF
jgi:hypothetical protein